MKTKINVFVARLFPILYGSCATMNINVEGQVGTTPDVQASRQMKSRSIIWNSYVSIASGVTYRIRRRRSHRRKDSNQMIDHDT